MKNKSYLLFNHPEQIALCYVKDIDNEFIDCETIFCSDEEITLSFNDVLHKVSLKPEPNEEEKKNIKEVLYNKMNLFKETIDKFLNNYGELED